MRKDKSELMWEVRKWLCDVSLEESWMSLLTLLNKKRIDVKHNRSHPPPQSLCAPYS